MSALLVLVVVVLAGWAVAFALRPRERVTDPRLDWEHWLDGSGLRPVVPRMQPVVEAARAAGADGRDVDRAALGRAADGATLVVVRLVDERVVVAARRTGPVPAARTATVRDGWQLVAARAPVADVFARADWVRTGRSVPR